MRSVVCIAILLLSLFAPVERLDVAKLQPVQTVAVSMNGQEVVLETDTGDVGRGVTGKEALKDLQENALSVIYLDTAEYLLVADGAEYQAEQLRPHLSGMVRVGEYGGGSVEEETKYWKIHGDLPKLRDWKPVK